VETLYRKPPHLVSVLTRGDRLKEEQLRVFGRSSRSYNVLAQVAAGFLPVRTPSLPEPDACAVTVQAVETRGSRGEVRLHLNIVGVRGDGQNLVEEVNESLDDRFLSVLVHARRRLADLEAALHRHRHERLRKVKRSTALRQEDIDRVAAIVLTVGRGFEQVSRQRVRRTKHAEDHVARGNRPTGKALEDASAAEAEKFLHDRRTGAIVVLGPRCRVHVFGTEGKHVTSLVLKGDQVERRLYTRRWEILDVVSRDRFLTRLRSRIDDEEARGA
jgi:hypothetical protein